MNLNKARFETTAVKPGQYPPGQVPEVALAGRSNVGKSSFINTLLNRKNLARTGNTPGKTKEINFYNIDDKLYLVDLPGYGYASVAKTKKATWSSIIETYLSARPQLKLIVLLLDIRHAPSDDDIMMLNWLIERNIPVLLAATKADKLNRSQQNVKLKEIKNELGLPEDTKVILFSAVSRIGIAETWDEIKSILSLD